MPGVWTCLCLLQVKTGKEESFCFFCSWMCLICLPLNSFLFENRDTDFCRILGIITWLPCMITLWRMNMYVWLYLMRRSFVDHELHDCVHCAFRCISVAEYYFSPLPFFFNQNTFVVFFVFLCPSWWQKVDFCMFWGMVTEPVVMIAWFVFFPVLVTELVVMITRFVFSQS